ncbi:Adenylate cyclase-associated CAP [Metarhizium album ARSEF 1941]|uniref:Adenylyl cyclase-associated protein n=1 Tax=Metarhizium album (strain ARSEF 1941) TaxID=1081103 RepID=A0A0B2WP83_METAS|nr:Adenylate cyclase-associated CAP [Metarhizium album ARSEF 1941]KHN97851.1 Adenylate cyclase-associated CAP [Metarhizium album ARSEF 1941]
MHNLTTLIKRLEAATSRLEDIATSTELPKDVPALKQTIASPTGVSLTSTTPSTATASVKTTPKQTEEPVPESIEEFQQFISSSVGKYVKISNELGGVVAKQAAEVLKGFQEQEKFLLITTKATKPDASTYQIIIKPINDALMAVTELKESNRPDPMYTNLSAVADGIMMLAWITMDTRPHKHVEESLSSAQFFGNRVLKEQKDKDPKQAEWIQSFYQVFRDLAEYVKQYFPSGITWNATGEPAGDVANSLLPIGTARGTSDAAGPSAPPPPPPGPPPVLDIKTEPIPAAPASSGGFDAVFSELNKGSAVTKGLRKVDKSEMTHKNPSLRVSNVADRGRSSRGKSPAPGKKPKPESMRVKKTPKMDLKGNKWTIENHDKETQPIEIETTLTQSVLISSCNNTTVVLKGKANQVTVENSVRLSLVVDTLVSTVDVIKAQNFALQVIGTLPTVMLDQVDGGQIYFSKESIGTKVFTSKSSGINLNILFGPDDDYKEVPLPSQICSYYDKNKGDLINEIVAHVG